MIDDPIDEDSAPNQFLCPISQQIMKDPVLTCDGFCFERRSIETWLRTRDTNPLTNTILPSKQLIENRALRNVIQQHNLRIRQIQRAANDNAQTLIRTTNQSLSELFPELANRLGFADLDKVATLAMENYSMRQLLKKASQKQTQLKKLIIANQGQCRNCKQAGQTLKQAEKLYQEQVAKLLNSKPVITNPVAVQQEQLSYVVINNELIKLVDFKRIKKSEFRKQACRGILLSKLTLEEVVQRIRLDQKIDAKDFVRVWVFDVSTDRIYDYISSEAESITGPYTGKVKCFGRQLQDMQAKVKDLGLLQDEYLAIEHGPGEEFIFRDKESKCDYCYKKSQVVTDCDCKKVVYCSHECKAKDKNYHTRVCILNAESLSWRNAKK